ncbi:MAG: hypothetical protein ACK56I_09960, partial [bacterium]
GQFAAARRQRRVGDGDVARRDRRARRGEARVVAPGHRLARRERGQPQVQRVGRARVDGALRQPAHRPRAAERQSLAGVERVDQPDVVRDLVAAVAERRLEDHVRAGDLHHAHVQVDDRRLADVDRHRIGHRAHAPVRMPCERPRQRVAAYGARRVVDDRVELDDDELAATVAVAVLQVAEQDPGPFAGRQDRAGRHRHARGLRGDVRQQRRPGRARRP